MLNEDWEKYFLSDVDDGTTFINQDEYIKCLEELRKYRVLWYVTVSTN